MRKHLILVFLALAAVACRKKVDMDPGMYESNDVSLMVKGKMAFTYTEGTMQLAFNRTLREFRVGNDDMSSYFILDCAELPREEGQEIRADLKYTSGSSVKSTTGLTFKVEKMETNTGLVWLWCAADKTGAVVKILN